MISNLRLSSTGPRCLAWQIFVMPVSPGAGLQLIAMLMPWRHAVAVAMVVTACKVPPANFEGI